MKTNQIAALMAILLAGAVSAKPLTVCTEASPDGFDVVQYNSLTNTNAAADPIFNRLLEYDAATGKLVPSLAQSWQVSDDQLQYTFKLRKNVAFQKTDYFQPSRALNADDVVFSFQRMLDPNHPWYASAPNGYPHAQSFGLAKLIASIKKTADDTVVIQLKQADATFLPLLSMGFMSIYSAQYADQLLAANQQGQLNTKPIGTGPFALKSFQKDAVIRYDAHPNYFAGQPKSDKLIYAITADPVVRVQKVKAGECQIALGVKPQDITAARNDKKLKVLSTPMFATAFVAINTQHKPLDKVEVRQALQLAFDQKAYLAAVFEGTASAAQGPFPPATWSYLAGNNEPQNLTKAKALLSKAGLPNGFETTIWVRPSGSTLNPNPRMGAEMLQADLAKIGVRAEIKTIEWAELIKRAKAGEHDLLFMGWSGDNGDPDNFLTPQFACASVESGLNFARFCQPQLDGLIRSGKTTAKLAERTQHYQAAQKIIRQQALWIPLAHPLTSVITTDKVSGYVVNPFGRQAWANVLVK
ncbi:ABC transporter substrate-binding protein [Deefgea salmonis]|uniref:ABC transporter substrate-binding protein n=1 Tax=Deefgea salmonis TaxID=2875502 RepID=A0ABS8BP84_9NEIS|nr:ABC transporter substrate-binding protein [Deefgea salmonis]MCB5197356.1 ABC transporter substrate-binding protein [Deefgea salmonis]